MKQLSTRLVLGAASLTAIVIAVDATIGREWDFLALAVILLGALSLLWFRMVDSRHPTSLRPDLARRLEREAAETGQSVEELVDRAVALRHHALNTEPT